MVDEAVITSLKDVLAFVSDTRVALGGLEIESEEVERITDYLVRSVEYVYEDLAAILQQYEFYQEEA